MTARELAGKKAIVTGASSGIGRATAHLLAKAGADIAGGARRAEELETAIALPLDVADPASCEQFVEEATARLGGLDILVNNAGVGQRRHPFGESTEEDEHSVLETNVAGLIRMTRLCLPHFGDEGHIVNVGSIAGRQAYAKGATYAASKFAVRGYTYALREDLLGLPIRLSTVDPGLVQTGFALARFEGDAELADSAYRGLEALSPEDVAECVLFVVTRPAHVNIDEIVVKPRHQATLRMVREDELP